MAVRILVTDSLMQFAEDQLVAEGYELVRRKCTPEEVGTVMRDFDGAIVRSQTKIRKPQIDAAKNSRLQVIIRGGVGTDNIDSEYAEACGIKVRNTPLASSNSVAELAVGLLFSCARNICLCSWCFKNGSWEKKNLAMGFELEGKTAGIIGYGRIGGMISHKVQALGMKVLSFVHRHKPEGEECETMHFVSEEETYAKSDVLFLCAPGGGEPIINRESLAKMKDGVVIINISRGTNIDEDALLEALNSGKVGAAGLDVWADEKNPNYELAKHPRVSPTTHLGASTAEAQVRIGNEIVQRVHENLPL